MVFHDPAEIFLFAHWEGRMVSEQEARACKHAFMRPAHPAGWGRAVGPLMTWAAFFLLAALGGLATQKVPTSTASMNPLATPNAITAQQPATGTTSPLQASLD